MNLTIATVDPVLHTIQCIRSYFAVFLIASSRKTHNSQSLESHNQNLTYGTHAGGAWSGFQD